MLGIELLYVGIFVYLFFGCHFLSSDQFINNSGAFLISIIAGFIFINCIFILIKNCIELVKKIWGKKLFSKLPHLVKMNYHKILGKHSKLDLLPSKFSGDGIRKSESLGESFNRNEFSNVFCFFELKNRLAFSRKNLERL